MNSPLLQAVAVVLLLTGGRSYASGPESPRGCLRSVAQAITADRSLFELAPNRGWVDQSSDHRYVVRDVANSEFKVHGTLNRRGILSSSLQTVSISSRMRSSALRGSEQFERMVHHFGDRLKGIQGFWVYGDNLAAINQLVNPPHNLTLEEAAAQTWTGQQSVKLGFTQVRVIPSETKLRETEPGSPTRYDSVSVLFERTEER